MGRVIRRPCIVCGRPSDTGRCPAHPVGGLFVRSCLGCGRPCRRNWCDDCWGYKQYAWRRTSEELRREIGCCEQCGATDGLEAHHIRKTREGGTHDRENLVVLCRRCHLQVHATE